MWDSEMKFVGKCSKVGYMDIFIEPEAMAKIEILMDKREDVEWLCYLIGEINWDERVTFITDILVPLSQGNSFATVDNIEVDETMRPYIIGPIHSHHSMGCFFSKDDWEYLNNNNDISIVVSKKSEDIEMLAAVRFKTECGCFTHIETDNIKINCQLEEDVYDNFVNEIGRIDEFGIQEFANFIKYPGNNPSAIQKRNIIAGQNRTFNYGYGYPIRDGSMGNDLEHIDGVGFEVDDYDDVLEPVNVRKIQ